MRQKNALTTSDVDKIIAAARKHAEANGWKVVIAVADDGGHLIGAIKLDGARGVAMGSATAKARSAALTGSPSSVMQEFVKSVPGIIKVDGLYALAGGVPIIVDGECIGGVGAAGGQGVEDEEIAAAGVAALI
jgi:uncharacterized protein GlcG (DUF336 family)